MRPNEMILEFVARQPDTIRDNLYQNLRLCFLSSLAELSDRNFEGIAIRILSDGEPFLMLYRAIVACAALDYAFSRDPANEFSKYLDATADKLGDADLKTVALQIPLREAHFQQSGKKWVELRQSVLSLEEFHKYEAILLAEEIHKSQKT